MTPTPVRIEFALGGERLEAEAWLPEGQVRPRDVLPTLHALADVVVRHAVRGQATSCRKGCGACCRQVVPISETEAHHLRALVDALPEPRRATIRTRFAAARERFARAGLLDRLRRPGEMSDEQRQALALDYFRQWAACPFLEDEACIIWPERPLACREYLVTTPAVNCSRPLEESVESVPMPGRVSLALGQLGTTQPERGVWWLPLILALEWTETHTEAPPAQDARSLLRTILRRLTA